MTDIPREPLNGSVRATFERSIYTALVSRGNGLAIARQIARQARLDGYDITEEQVSLMAQAVSRGEFKDLADESGARVVDPGAPAKGLRADEYPKKPTNCKCGFPLVMARNMCGHDENCPCYGEWIMGAFLTKEHSTTTVNDCPGCDNYFKHASFPAAHMFKLSTRSGEHPSNPDGAEPFGCWEKHRGVVHCEVALDREHALRVSYLCFGCGWYMQECATNFQVVEGKIKIIYREDREPVIQIRLPIPMPWKEMKGWSIVGMNHYFVEGAKKERHLFVAMVNRAGRCIKAEGPDESAVFEDLQKKAAHRSVRSAPTVSSAKVEQSR